jgi:hypothetical protein
MLELFAYCTAVKRRDSVSTSSPVTHARTALAALKCSGSALSVRNYSISLDAASGEQASPLVELCSLLQAKQFTCPE